MSLGSIVILYSLYLMSVAGQISLNKKPGQQALFSCQFTDQICSYVYWYQKKEGEPFILILRTQKDSCTVDSSYGHPNKNDFSVTRKGKKCILKIQLVQVSHSATYYCTCWESSTALVFGSGTRLYVTDNDSVRKPNVTVYPASKPEPNGKTTMLCLAGDMFPDLVKISWKMEDENNQTAEVPKAEMEELEQREEGQTTSMIIIDKEKTHRNKYICSVEHEWGPQYVVIPKAPPTCLFRNDTQEPQTLHLTDDSFQSTYSLNLASLVYTVMIEKSMVYCCGLYLLLHHWSLGRGSSTSTPIH